MGRDMIMRDECHNYARLFPKQEHDIHPTARMLARYNAWPTGIFDAVAALPGEEATKQRKSLFKNMSTPLNHNYVIDASGSASRGARAWLRSPQYQITRRSPGCGGRRRKSTLVCRLERRAFRLPRAGGKGELTLIGGQPGRDDARRDPASTSSTTRLITAASSQTSSTRCRRGRRRPTCRCS